MRLNLDMNILRHMTDGVLVLDRFAQIVAFNKIAEPWVQCCQSMHAATRRLINEERQGRLVLPIFIDLQKQQAGVPPQRTDAWLCKNGLDEYAIFVVSPTAAVSCTPTSSSPKNQQHNLMALVGTEVREQLSILRSMMRPTHSRQHLAKGDMERQCQKVEQLMQEVTDLSRLLENDEVFSGERLSISDIVENILLSLPTGPHQVLVEMQTATTPLGPVYGNGAWLSYALRLLIGGLVANASANTVVHIAARQMGDFLTLSGRCAGSTAEADRTKAAHASRTQNRTAAAQAANIQLMMCKRIIELHAGQLTLIPVRDQTITANTPINVEAFSLTLMTSVPANERSHASCADCRHIKQQLSYASDLAQLIASTQTTFFDRSL